MIDCENVLKTKLQTGRSSLDRENKSQLKEKRIKRLNEAMLFKSGTRENPKKHIITLLPNNIEVYFFKPGKEVFRAENTNDYDMTPMVSGVGLLSFNEIFDIILKVSLTNKGQFKKLLTLIYRLAYMLDFEEMKGGKLRYALNRQILNCIEDIEKDCKDCFGSYGLLGFLNFLDILGWNEDDKYHMISNKPDFNNNARFNIGRINTLLSCIAIPCLASDFVEHVLAKKDNPKNINHNNILDIIQRLINSKGICVPKRSEILEWLKPYLYI